MATSPVALDFSKAQPIEQGGVALDFSKAQRLDESEKPELLDRTIPLSSYGNATLSGLQSVGRGVRGALKGAGEMLDPRQITTGEKIGTTLGIPYLVTRMVKGLGTSAAQIPQIPAAVSDINASPDPLGTYAHAAQETAGEGAGQAIAALATEGLVRGIPKMGELVPRGLGAKAKAVGKLAAQDAISHIPAAGRLVRRPSFGDYMRAARTKAPIPESGLASEPLGPPTPPPEVLHPELVSPSRTLPGQISPEIIRPKQVIAAPIPARKGLALPPAEPLPMGQVRSQIDTGLREGLGNKPVRPGIPMRDQFKPEAPVTEQVPEGHTAADSSAVKSFKYDPQASEMHVQAKDGITHVYGEVNPEQARNFILSDSKGKAWKALRDSSSPKVAKIMPDGTRVSTRGASEFKSVGPESEPPPAKIPAGEDLEPILKESLKRAKGRGLPRNREAGH